jgi:hypothetical protein
LDALEALDVRLEAVERVGGHRWARPCGSDFARAAMPMDPPPQPVLLLAWDAGAASDDAAESSEERLAGLAAAVGPLRRALAAIAERLIATRAHERLGYARLGDYARERAGLSARQLQELARVHRALAGLPALERALVANQLPWSKVRLIARVATAADEDAWIARARAVPTRRLEGEVREASRGPAPEDAEEALPHTRVRVRCTPAVLEKWGRVRELAERGAGQRLRDGEVLELVAAEVFSAISIDPAFAENPEEPPARRRSDPTAPHGMAPYRMAPYMEGRPAPRGGPRGLPRAIASLAAALEAADAFELDRRLQRAVQLEQTLDAAIAPLLRRVTSPEYEWRGEYCALASYAREQLGMSASKARALLRLERAGEVCPELRDAYRSGRLSWVKAQCLLPLLLLDIEGEWRPIWVAWAERVTVRRLERDVERALLLRAGHDPAWQRCKFQPERAREAIPEAERQLCAHDVDTEATEQLCFRVPYEVAALFRAVSETLRAALGGSRCDGEVFDALLDGALLAWSLRDPRARRPDPVIERDGYRCAVPGCTSRRNLHDHHVVFRSAGGSDAADNRVTLCAFHHQRGVHAGIVRVSGRAPDALVFELGLRAGAPPLARYRSGDVAIAHRYYDLGAPHSHHFRGTAMSPHRPSHRPEEEPGPPGPGNQPRKALAAMAEPAGQAGTCMSHQPSAEGPNLRTLT